MKTCIFGALAAFFVACNSAHAEDWAPFWSTAQLSLARSNLSATSIGNLVFFGGGNTSAPSNVVDVYNVDTGFWSTATLSQARYEVSAAAAGNEAFFGGGNNGGNDGTSNVVDIYNTSTNIWSTATLSQARNNLSASSAGDEVLFAGGQSNNSGNNNGPGVASTVVDIYNTSSGIWSTANLSQARQELAATSAGNLVFFGGGNPGGTASSVVDIYNTTNGAWSTASLSQARYELAATSAADQVFFGGGQSGGASNVVDIYNTTSGVWSTAALSQARLRLSATSAGGLVFFAGGITDPGNPDSFSNVVDIYNTTTGTWSTASLSQPRQYLSATSAGNQVFFAGGVNSGGYSNVVDVYTFQNYPSINSTKTFGLVGNTTVAGRMQLNGGSLELANYSLTVGSMSGVAPIDLGSSVLTTGSDGTSTTYSGPITGNGSLIKIGNGTLVLSGGSNYTGGTTISGGALKVANNSGSATGSNRVYVNGGGTLGGSGNIGGLVSVASGGQLSPSLGVTNATTILNLTGGLSLAEGSILDMDLSANNGSDLVSVIGNLALGTGGTLDINAFSGPLPLGTYELVDFTGTVDGDIAGWNAISGNDPSRQYSFGVFGGDQFDLTVTAVPEPASITLSLVVVAGLSLLCWTKSRVAMAGKRR